MPGVFARPRRQVLGTQGLVQRSIPVATVDQLKAAIGAAIARANAGFASGGGIIGAFGTEIVIEQPLALTTKVVIPASLPGIVIRAIGNVPITAVGVVDALFEVHAPFATLRDLFVYADPNNIANRFTTFVKIGAWVPAIPLGPDDVHLQNCFVNADQFYLDAGPSFQPKGWHITGCRFSQMTGTAFAVDGGFDSSCFVDSEWFGCANVFRVRGGGGGNRIGNNALSGGIVDTSASAGSNTIIGNTSLSAGSAFNASDVHAGLNT